MSLFILCVQLKKELYTDSITPNFDDLSKKMEWVREEDRRREEALKPLYHVFTTWERMQNAIKRLQVFGMCNYKYKEIEFDSFETIPDYF